MAEWDKGERFRKREIVRVCVCAVEIARGHREGWKIKETYGAGSGERRGTREGNSRR